MIPKCVCVCGGGSRLSTQSAVKYYKYKNSYFQCIMIRQHLVLSSGSVSQTNITYCFHYAGVTLFLVCTLNGVKIIL